MIQFGTINVRTTFKNYFGQFVLIEKKESLLVAFHFLKRRLKKRQHLRADRPRYYFSALLD